MEEKLKDEATSFLAPPEHVSCFTGVRGKSRSREFALRRSGYADLVCSTMFVVCSFLAHFLSTGISFSIGVYYVTFLEAFGQSNGLTAWVGSLNFGSLCAAGPVASVLLRRYGCGMTVCIGGLMSGFGLLLSAYATNIYFVFATYGVLAGAGFGLVFAASMTVITLEFDRWRKLALGLSLSGIGLGTCVHPVLANVFIHMYGWRGALMLTSALVLNACAMGLLIRLASNIKRQNNPHLYPTQIQPTYNTSKLSLDINSNDKLNIYTDIKETEYYGEKSCCSLAYVILHVNVILYCFGQSVIYTHIVSYALHKGHSIELCSTLISVIGVSNVVGRVILGAISEHSMINITVLYSMCYAASGICCYGYCLWNNYVAMAAMMALLGFTMGAFGPLLSEIVCITVGVEQFASAYGYLMISMAAGTLLGAPSAGWLFDVTNVYEFSCYLGGLTFIVSGVVMVVPSIQSCVRNRLATQHLQETVIS